MTKDDLPLYLPAVVGTSLTAPADIGGAASATKITGGAIGELLFAMSANALGGADKEQTQKFFQANDHESQDLTNAVMWLDNHMTQPSGNKVTRAQSTSNLDGAGKYLKVIGNNNVPADAAEEFQLAGTTLASGVTAFSKRWSVTLHDLETNALVTADGFISIYHDDELIAVMRPNAHSVTSEISIGLADELDDVETFDDAGSAPAGITFSQPRTPEDGVAVANSGVLPAGSKQGGYLLWVCADGRRPSTDVETYPLIKGDESE